MSLKLEWIYQKRVLFGRASGDMTVEDIRAASQAYYQLIGEGVPLVHSIFDVRDLGKLPNLIQARSAMSYKLSPKEGWLIVVGGNSAMRFFASVLLQLFNYRFRMVATTEEAVEFLSKHDDSLQGFSMDVFSSVK